MFETDCPHCGMPHAGTPLCASCARPVNDAPASFLQAMAVVAVYVVTPILAFSVLIILSKLINWGLGHV